MWILGQWFSKQTVEQIEDVAKIEPEISRRSLARRVCGWLDWRNEKGELREASGKKALAELEKKEIIKLPKPTKIWSFASKNKQKAEKKIEVKDLPIRQKIACNLEELGGLKIVPVASRYSKDSKRWNELMRQHHYLGAGPLCGTQIRYLVRSEIHGDIGCLSFSAASKRLKCRDKWIGWSERAQRANLEKVICNSRFLICPEVQVPNLASRILGLALAQLPIDWKDKYGYEPALVETFVDPDKFKGTCYKAANWDFIGETASKKEAFKNGKVSTGKKSIYVRPLREDFKAILSKEPHEPLVIRGQACDAKDWADEEFGSAQVHEGRLRARLSCLARDFFKQPGKPISSACDGLESKTKAAYRFFSNKRLNMKDLLKGHIESTIERAQKYPIVLAVQDTTTLNFTAHSSTNGIGPINTKKDGATGLILHDTLGFTLEGVPLGLMDAQCWARDFEEAGKSQKRKQLPIEEKESIKWLNSYRAVAEAQLLCPNTTFVSTGDRESDIYELFLEAQQTEKSPKLLIRADRARQRKVRCINEEEVSENYEYLWDNLSAQPVGSTIEIYIPRKANRPARNAILEIRYAKVMIKPPKNKHDFVPIEAWAVYAKEVGYSDDVKEPVDWMVITTVPVNNAQDACERVQWYSLRWGIEVFHRVIKSGCRVEDRQLCDAESIKNCLAIDLVVAWRIYWLTKLGRETPNVPCDIILSEDEWKVLYAVVHKKTPPQKPPALRDAVRMIARLGGFLGRKCDKEPGTISIWRGWTRLESMVEGYTAAQQVRNIDDS